MEFYCPILAKVIQTDLRSEHQRTDRVVKSSQLPAKIATYLVSIGQLLCLTFFYGWRFLNKISLDWPLTLTTQPSTSKLSDIPEEIYNNCIESFTLC